MIEITRINGDRITINAEEIEIVETAHDTTISLKSGRKIAVKETSAEITEKVIEYRKQINAIK
jgi:flagellar protein FlbD